MDKFILDEKNYTKIQKLEKEKEKKQDQNYVAKNKYTIDNFQLKNHDMKQKHIYNNDFFHIREKGDNLLNNWIKQQKDPIIIFLSDFIPGTKVSKEIEKFRPIIKTTPTISIEEYRKKKKIGEEGVEYLKRLKDKYGIIVLKVLWANLNF